MLGDRQPLSNGSAVIHTGTLKLLGIVRAMTIRMDDSLKYLTGL